MKVHRRKHHVPRQDKRLERHDAARVDSEHDSAVPLEKPQRSNELFGIVASGCNARKIRVALEIVHAVGVQVRPADQLAKRRVATFRTTGDQAQHVAAVHLERCQAGGEVGQP
jgi:hypothetical protein